MSREVALDNKEQTEVNMITKTCLKCKRKLPLTSEYFYRRSKNRDGLEPRCKECRRQQQLDYYHNNLESCRQRNRMYKRNNRIPTGNSVGRPRDYVVSDTTKQKIAETKTGGAHSDETKDKISAAVVEYWRIERDTVSDEMLDRYKDSQEALDWIIENAEDINADLNIRTEKNIFGTRLKEVPIDYIEEITADNTNPEDWIIAKDLQEKLPKHSPILKKLLKCP